MGVASRVRLIVYRRDRWSSLAEFGSLRNSQSYVQRAGEKYRVLHCGGYASIGRSFVLRSRRRDTGKQHPQVTAREIKQNLAPDIPLREQAISRLLKECRLGVAKRCPVQIPKLQYLDNRTVLRVRIAQIWRRHPEYTGKQVLQRLGLEHPVPLPWVQHVLKDCWLAETRHSPAQRMKGRRIYPPRRACSQATMRALKARSAAAFSATVMQRAEGYRVYIDWALRQLGKYGRPISAQYAAEKLNERGVLVPRGGRWHANTVKAMWKTLGMHHPPVGACRPSRHAGDRSGRGTLKFSAHKT